MKNRILLLASLFLLVPAAAQAQRTTIVPLRTMSWGPSGSFSSIAPFSTYPGFAPYSYYSGFGGYGYGAYPYGAFRGYGYGYGGSAFMGNEAGYFSSGYMNAEYRSTEKVFTGFITADHSPRARTNIHPAIAAPSKELIRAALEDEEGLPGRIEVHLPTPESKVYLDDVLTVQTGATRQFHTPCLPAGARCKLRIRVVYRDAAGQECTLQRHLQICPGENRRLDFRQ